MKRDRWLLSTFRRPTLGHLLLSVLSLAALSQLAVGVLLYFRLQEQLESDLARRLVHVSRLLTQSVDPALVSQFGAGDEHLAAYALLRRRLAGQAEAAGVSGAYVFDVRSRILIDSDETQPPGVVRHRLLAHRAELRDAFAGKPVATRLYADESGRLRLSAFAPLRGRGGLVTAVVGVDAPPAFFATLAVLRREMLALGVVGVGLAALTGLLVVRQVEARLGRLRQSVTRAVRGDPRLSGPPHGDDPIGALGRDLEDLIAAIVAAREYQQAVLGSLDLGVLTCDAEGRLTLINASARALLRHGPDALVGRPLEEVLEGEPSLLALARSAASGGRAVSSELPIAGGASAGGRVLRVDASRLVQEGKASGLVLSLLDVTEQREAARKARENERLAALGGMAGGLLHELGNPLAALTMYLDLLRPLTPAGEGRDLADRALREDARVREFLEDFRVFAGLAALRRERVELAAVVEKAMEPLTWPPEIRRTLSGSARVRADGRLLAHAIRNLLRNAREALPAEGHVEVELACREGEATVSVSDDGPGLSLDAMERVLEPFHTTKPHGSGLGLLIVRRVMELHGGRLEARRHPESGTCFTLRWPAADEEEETWRAS